MIYKFSSSSKFGVNIPWLNQQFMHNVLDIAGSRFPSSLVFYMEEVSIELSMDNPVTSSQF